MGKNAKKKGNPSVNRNNQGGGMSKKERNQFNKKKVVAWLQSYVSQDKEMLALLGSFASGRQWSYFADAIRKKWLSFGKDREDIFFLDNHQHCLHVWSQLNDIDDSGVGNLQETSTETPFSHYFDDTSGPSSVMPSGGKCDEMTQNIFHSPNYNQNNSNSAIIVGTNNDSGSTQRKSEKVRGARRGKVRNQERKKIIIAWLQDYLAQNSESNILLQELRPLANERRWGEFRNALKRKWLSVGQDIENTFCLDNSQHCMDIWRSINEENIHVPDYPGDRSGDSRYVVISDPNFIDQSTTESSNFDQIDNHDHPRNIMKSPKMNKHVKEKEYRTAKNQKKKERVIAWLKVYTEEDPDGRDLLPTLKSLADDRRWFDFGNTIKKKWWSTDQRQEDSFCLDNTEHCIDIWEQLTEKNDSSIYTEDMRKFVINNWL